MKDIKNSIKEEIKNQIDQKFEELKCRSEKHKEKERVEALGLFDRACEILPIGEALRRQCEEDKLLDIKVEKARNLFKSQGFKISGSEKIFREFVRGFTYEDNSKKD